RSRKCTSRISCSTDFCNARCAAASPPHMRTGISASRRRRPSPRRKRCSDVVNGDRTSDYDVALPPELIAQQPPAERGASRLLVVNRGDGTITHRTFADLPEFIPAGDVLV